MGVLRLILALSVVAGHGDFWRPFFFINSSAAVICFFVVSGFYMALVLNEKYTDTASFFAARAIRLYPAYFFFLAIVMAVMLRGGATFDPLVLATSLTIVGLDYLIIYAQHPLGPIPIGQAWSIAVELQFYAVAALFFKSRGGIVSVMLIGLLLHVALNIGEFFSTPLEVRLSLNTLVFFGMGGIAYLAYRRIDGLSAAVRLLLAAGAAACFLVIPYLYDGLRIDPARPDWRFYPIYLGVAALVPSLFSLTKNNRVDRLLGELSYPIYLCHVFVYAITERLQQGPWFFLILLLGLSALSHLLVERPIRNLALRSLRKPSRGHTVALS